MNSAQFIAKYRAEIILAAVLLLSGFLNIWNLWGQGISNAYYAAAVKSMLENPGMLFFNSFDPAGFITVDKPPVGLWIQAASAVLLGYSGWALVLPQALAGVGSVGLIYLIVSRPFGKPAGLVSAFALAITPIFAAVSRNETPDGLLIFVLLLALWVALKAARERSLPYLLLSVVLVGIGFNIKMIQAFIVVPAILAIYLLGAREIPVKKRAIHLALAIMVLLAVSLSWAVAVDMVPADQRPYIGGSGDNTVLGLIVNYNGIHRLADGMTGGPGNGPGSLNTGDQAGTFAAGGPRNQTAGMAVDRSSDRMAAAGGTAPPSGREMPAIGYGPSGVPVGGPEGMSPPDSGTAGAPGGGMMGDTGTPGFLRLFTEDLAGQISWLLPFGVIGLFALWRRPASLSIRGFRDAWFSGERGTTLAGICLWLFPGLAYFSFTTGFWHPYYLATIAPPLAALVGIGAIAMYRSYGEGWPGGWVLVGAVAVTGFVQVIFLSYNAEWAGPLVTLVTVGTIISTILLAGFKLRNMTGPGNLPKAIAIIAIGLLFIAPLVWAFTPVAYGDGGNLPAAGPHVSRGGAGMGGGNSIPGPEDGTTGLARYLASHNTGETWDLAVPSSMNGANLIIESNLSVMSLGGFSGSDQVLTVTGLTRLVNEGKIRFFLSSASSQGGGMGGMGSQGAGSGNSELFTWVSDHCTTVPTADWGGTGTTDVSQGAVPGLFTNITTALTPGAQAGSGNSRSGPGGGEMLYDCAGYRGQSGA